ncbi:ABC transporter substrate-binding protein [Thalassobellus suaedae]|uniref:ABC transporter substrate-binding protein n=1 Tax=Thalassobellus suaedae TaxID=3074124 RepID=A0ABY9Y4L5_9FLAO|nr:ABC transporter substrate-binding protein [Flavobacteriaceae bacterium HL-DH10]
MFFSSCKEKTNTKTVDSKTTEIVSQNIKYAKSFSINNHSDYKEIIVTSAWPKSTETYKYILIKEGQAIPEHDNRTIVIKIPIKKVVVMSTTNIPVLEYLNIEDRLVGFPNTDYISSKKTRQLIESGKVKDLNNDLEINMELLLDINPELVIGFSVNGNDKSLNKIEKFGIPVVLDGAWTEQHPLGRSEWIKFIAAFFDKDEEAKVIFDKIETDYLEAKALAKKTETIPTVISGSLFKDVWNIPGGHSFVAKYLEDANTNYLWKNDQSTGSLQLNFENVLEKGQKADLWIGAGSFKNKEEMLSNHNGYSYFEAFKNNKTYTYTNKIGSKGGLMYYELGPMRPDLILKDIIKIAHPELLPTYEYFFFKTIE